MSAPLETFRSYGALLQRLVPQLSHALITSPNGSVLWVSDAEAVALLESTRATLERSATPRTGDIDGIADMEGSGSRFGFHVRSADGGTLACVLLSADSVQHRPLDLATVHAQIRPALDCLQSELSARTRPDDPDTLSELPTLALRALNGAIGMLLLPECHLALYGSAEGHTAAADGEMLGQLHELLLKRAQVQRRTLVANLLQPAMARVPMTYKVISTPIFDVAGRVIGVLAVFRADSAADFQPADSAALEALSLRAGQIATTSYDFATGFLSEAAFVAQAQARIAAQPPSAGSSGVLYVDIDQLHVINESHGMPVGDEIICKIAQLLRARAHCGTLLARMAGDRFAMFVPGCSIEPVARIAEEIRASAIRLSSARADKPLQVSLSVGVSRIAEGERQFRRALSAAEVACQAAKDRGSNRVEVFYGNLPAERALRRVHNAAVKIAAGSVRESLELVAQPVLPLGLIPATPRFEIFMRMRAPDGTRVSFEKLQGAGADADLPRAIDRVVVEQTVARLAAQRELLQKCRAQFLVNLSADSLGAHDFWQMLEDLLRTANLPPDTLAFEFSEDAALSQIATLPGRMQHLQQFGVRFAIDNFGRGIGSLSNLASLPLACIKIDGRLSLDLVRNPKSQSMLLAITRLAQGFGLETIATQVETDAIRACAAAIGVDFGQGFFIGRLLDLDDALRDLPLYSCFEASMAAVG